MNKQVKFKQWDCILTTDRKYGNGRTALELIDAEDGSPIAVATVNIPEAEVGEDEVLIKDWSENEGMEAALIKAEVIGPAVGLVPTGFVMASKHKLLI